MAPTEDTSTERRLFTRISFDAPAQIFTGEHTLQANVRDLSLRGALVELEPTTQWSPVSGNYCEIVIKLDESEVQIYMHARVAHVINDHTIGLLCEHIDLQSIEHLRRLVELNLGDTSLLERELQALCSQR